MPQTCSICIHPDRAEIEKALIAGEPLRDIERRCPVSRSALHRHRQEHLSQRLVKAAEHEDLAQAIDVVRQLKAINAATLEILQQSRADGKHAVSLRAVDRVQKQIELQAKLLGDLHEGQTVNVAILPEWHGIRQVVLQALRPHPDARTAVVEALRRTGA